MTTSSGNTKRRNMPKSPKDSPLFFMRCSHGPTGLPRVATTPEEVDAAFELPRGTTRSTCKLMAACCNALGIPRSKKKGK